MQRGAATNSPRLASLGGNRMPAIRPGYFRIPPVELGATLILVPAYTGGLSALEMTLWARNHGFGDIAYIPAKAKPDTGVHA